MKKFVITVLSGLLVFSLIACNSSAKQPSSTDGEISIPDNSKTEESIEGTDSKDIDTDTQYALGDIILADGSTVKAEDLTAIDRNNVPIAVIAGFQENGTAFGIGVHRSASPLQWASDASAGYATNFKNIVCTQKSALDFSGDKDGSDNWEMICTQDNKDTSDSAVNYPAFHFVNTYAETYGLNGEYASGWYMPSIAELCKIYQNREVINNSLQHINSLDNDAAMNGLATNWYWSSSQSGSENDYAWFVHYLNGYAGECPKNFTNVHALAVRVF